MNSMYFIAVVAPANINETILKWKYLMKEKFGCQVALRSPAHITLIPPFWMEDVLEERLKDTLNIFCRSQKSFEIDLKNFDAFKPRVIFVNVLQNKSLQSLRDQLQEFVIGQGQFPVVKEERPFHAHISIAARDLRKKAFREAWELFKHKEYEAAWVARGISLLKHNQKNWDVISTSQFDE